ALGNPYVLRNFGNVTAYLARYSNVAPSEIAAARATLGEIAITGRLPVTIPGQAAVRSATGGKKTSELRSDWQGTQRVLVAVGMRVASHPPHGSVRAELPHTALTSDGWRQSAAPGMDAPPWDEATSV